MSLGNWDPDTAQANSQFKVDGEILGRYISISQRQQLDQVSSLIPAAEQQVQAALMQLSHQHWLTIAPDYSEDEIVHLMRFFTVAEKLPGWEAGENSPVIWLGKILKQRGVTIDRDLVVWIKANSDNRFLPHGPLC